MIVPTRRIKGTRSRRMARRPFPSPVLSKTANESYHFVFVDYRGCSKIDHIFTFDYICFLHLQVIKIRKHFVPICSYKFNDDINRKNS